jgi:hypothetical protein
MLNVVVRIVSFKKQQLECGQRHAPADYLQGREPPVPIVPRRDLDALQKTLSSHTPLPTRYEHLPLGHPAHSLVTMPTELLWLIP